MLLYNWPFLFLLFAFLCRTGLVGARIDTDFGSESRLWLIPLLRRNCFQSRRWNHNELLSCWIRRVWDSDHFTWSIFDSGCACGGKERLLLAFRRFLLSSFSFLCLYLSINFLKLLFNLLLLASVSCRPELFLLLFLCFEKIDLSDSICLIYRITFEMALISYAEHINSTSRGKALVVILLLLGDRELLV